jgi:ribonuclease-3
MAASSTGSASAAPPDQRDGRSRHLAALEARLAYHFADKAHLEEALTHASHKAVPKAGAPAPDNERLEFLGDRVLGLVIAEALLERFPEAREGALALRLNALVRKETLATLAEELGLPEVINLARGETLEGSRARGTILSDACEAVIAAIYCDGGFAAARDFVLRLFGPLLTTLDHVPQDAKTALQEWAQGRSLPTPRYTVMGREGPDHEPRFKVSVSVEGFPQQEGEGASKRAAEQAAALALLTREKLR